MAIIARVKSKLVEPRPGTPEYVIYGAYERGLYALGAMDFEDMITLAISSLDEACCGSSWAYAEVCLYYRHPRCACECEAQCSRPPPRRSNSTTT